ncbi:MAG: hypothetical protein PHH71_01480 [Clostridia bacterium]|jgi:nitrogen regulatory protein PII|nr:hypothetical protein [Clostridia bacterium]MDD3232028.1 hypothetical protein [Clostridia bacterium]MDD4408273.1 hypothetical protein [Clostridia bacterium]
MLKQIEIIITTQQITEKLGELFKKYNLNSFIIPKCKGSSQHSNFLEFIGFANNRYEILGLSCKEQERLEILNFLLTNYNKANNGIMFSIGGEKMKTKKSESGETEQKVVKPKHKLLVVILNSGYSEKVADILRKTCSCGATMFDARGTGADYTSFMGIAIDSNKEIIISVVPSKDLRKVKNPIKEELEKNKVDFMIFELPVTNYNKLHNSDDKPNPASEKIQPSETVKNTTEKEKTDVEKADKDKISK